MKMVALNPLPILAISHPCEGRRESIVATRVFMRVLRGPQSVTIHDHRCGVVRIERLLRLLLTQLLEAAPPRLVFPFHRSATVVFLSRRSRRRQYSHSDEISVKFLRLLTFHHYRRLSWPLSGCDVHTKDILLLGRLSTSPQAVPTATHFDAMND